MNVAAFFDLDRTLLAVNSGALWVRREYRLGRISRWQFAQALLYLLAYRFGSLDMLAVTRKALATVEGEEERAIARRTRDWYFDEVAPHVTSGARAALRDHRAAGHQLVLLTTSSPYESAAVEEHLCLDGRLHSHYDVRDGRLTGEVVLPLCFAEGKVHYAEEYARAHDVDLAQSYFYSDSASDLPMLRRVGHPRAVNPDWRLRRVARRRGWPVLDWSDT